MRPHVSYCCRYTADGCSDRSAITETRAGQDNGLAGLRRRGQADPRLSNCRTARATTKELKARCDDVDGNPLCGQAIGLIDEFRATEWCCRRNNECDGILVGAHHVDGERGS